MAHRAQQWCYFGGGFVGVVALRKKGKHRLSDIAAAAATDDFCRVAMLERSDAVRHLTVPFDEELDEETEHIPEPSMIEESDELPRVYRPILSRKRQVPPPDRDGDPGCGETLDLSNSSRQM